MNGLGYARYRYACNMYLGVQKAVFCRQFDTRTPKFRALLLVLIGWVQRTCVMSVCAGRLK